MEILGYCLVALTFLFAAFQTRAVAKARHDARYGWWLFLSTVVLLGLNVLSGNAASNALLAEQKLTAASLVWLVVFVRSLPVVLMCWLIKNLALPPKRP